MSVLRKLYERVKADLPRAGLRANLGEIEAVKQGGQLAQSA